MKRLDLHLHPLSHVYYFGLTDPQEVKELTRTDKERIETMVYWCIKRGIDIISITDHDMLLPSLYAIEYVKKNNLPITVIPGAEIELECYDERAHFCAWGIKELPLYKYNTEPRDVVEQVHKQGGIIILNHPQFSRRTFKETIHMLDGFEVINADEYRFYEGLHWIRNQGLEKVTYDNSDYHYEFPHHNLPDDPKYYPKYINEWDDEYTAEWLKQFKL